MVKNTHFYVNTLEKTHNTSLLDKYKNIREGDAKKLGLKNSKRNISAMVERQILASREIRDAPVSMLKEEDYKYKGTQPPYKVFDKTLGKDFDTCTASTSLARKGNPTSTKVKIAPISAAEKAGGRWS